MAQHTLFKQNIIDSHHTLSKMYGPTYITQAKDNCSTTYIAQTGRPNIHYTSKNIIAAQHTLSKTMWSNLHCTSKNIIVSQHILSNLYGPTYIIQAKHNGSTTYLVQAVWPNIHTTINYGSKILFCVFAISCCISLAKTSVHAIKIRKIT